MCKTLPKGENSGSCNKEEHSCKIVASEHFALDADMICYLVYFVEQTAVLSEEDSDRGSSELCSSSKVRAKIKSFSSIALHKRINIA
jgi:hypothetical protein